LLRTIPADPIVQSPITLIIAGLTVLVSIQAFSNSALFSRLLLHPWSVHRRREYYRLLSHALIHADTMHLFLNMFVFWSFGSFLENLFGREELFVRLFPDVPYWGEPAGALYFVLLYFGGVVVATLPAMRRHRDNPAYQAVGASGAVSAVMMAFMIMFPTYQVLFFFVIPCPAWLGALIFLGVEHWLSRRGRTHIAHDAHIWGALYGIAFVTVLYPGFIPAFFRSVAASLGF
jgi:membrane associated rhomboid family serine protease